MSLPFDASPYTAEELASARLVVHQFYRKGREQQPPEGPFDSSLYSASELTLIRDAAVALRQGVSAYGPVRAQLRQTEHGHEARLVQCRDHQESDESSALPLTDWFACPQPDSGSLLSSSSNDAHSREVPTSSETQLPGSEEPIEPVMCLCYGIRRSNRDGKLVTEVVRPSFFDGKQITQEDHPTFFSRKPFALRSGSNAPEDRDSP